MIINYRGRKLEVKCRKVSFFGKYLGLMFKNKNTANLFFSFSSSKKRAIHSLFVFFDFLAVWLDDNNKVIEIRRVRPFSLEILPKKEFRLLIELPFNNKNLAIIENLVGKRKI